MSISSLGVLYGTADLVFTLSTCCMFFTLRKIVPRNPLLRLKSVASLLGLFHTVIKIDKSCGSGAWPPSWKMCERLVL